MNIDLKLIFRLLFCRNSNMYTVEYSTKQSVAGGGG